MPVPSSGQLRLRADINQEVNGNDTDDNVSLGTLSNDAGFTDPDNMSEFYGYSSEVAPTITYVGQSSTYTTITLTYDVDWGGTTSGNWGVYIDVYSGQNLGTSWYGTQNPLQNTGGGQPSGTTRYNLTITPTSQYYYNYFDYKLKVFAYNSVGTTQSAGNFYGYRLASVQSATSYTWARQQSSYSGWTRYQNPSGSLRNGSYIREQMNHPQLGWYTTHQTTFMPQNSNHPYYSGSLGVQYINYSYPTNSSSVADASSSSGIYHKNAYPSSLSSGSRPNKRQIMYLHYLVTPSVGANNFVGIQHSGSMSPYSPDYDYVTNNNLSVSSSPNGYYNQNTSWSGAWTGQQYNPYSGYQASVRPSQSVGGQQENVYVNITHTLS